MPNASIDRFFRRTGGCGRRGADSSRLPASKSKQEFKDCEIFEEFLEIVTTLRSNGFDKPAVFVTPNKQDYGDPPIGHERIASDLNAAGAVYTANISWALAFAGRVAG